MSKGKQNKIVISVRFLVIVIAALLITCTVFIIILANQSPVSKPQKLNFTSDSEYIYTGTGFMYTRSGSVIYDDISDSEENYTGKLPNSDVKLAGYGRNTHAVYDSSTLSIVGLENAIVANGTIKSVECGNGYIACLTERENTDHITVYDTKGNVIEEIDPGNTVTLFGFTHMSEEQLYTVTLDTNSEAYISTISTYDPAIPAMTGIITVQNQLVENVVFTKKSIFVDGTTNLIRYDINDNKESYRLIKHGYRMSDYYVSGDKAYFIMQSNMENRQSTRIYIASQDSVPSEQIFPIQVPDDSLDVFICDGSVYAITKTRIYMYNTSGNLRESESLKIPADAIYHLKDETVLLIGDGNTYIFTVTGTNKIKGIFNK